METKNVLIGCDPEVFVLNKWNNKITSAHGLLNGTKMQPEIVDRGAIQIDGMALEFNIIPAATLKEFLTNIDVVMKSLKERIQAKNPSFDFAIQPVATFSQSDMDMVPEENRILGCEPDYNAYTGKENHPPNDKRLFRTGAGHIHIGWTNNEKPHQQEHFHDCQVVTKQLDSTLFSISELWDNDRVRRTMYGAKGAFRPKHYGVEYRVLSNRWLLTKKLQAWIYLATKRSMQLLEDGFHLYTKDEFHVRNASWIHEHLVKEYEFPCLPGYKV